jgi:hypothetical protein
MPPVSHARVCSPHVSKGSTLVSTRIEPLFTRGLRTPERRVPRTLHVGLQMCRPRCALENRQNRSSDPNCFHAAVALFVGGVCDLGLENILSQRQMHDEVLPIAVITAYGYGDDLFDGSAYRESLSDKE